MGPKKKAGIYTL